MELILLGFRTVVRRLLPNKKTERGRVKDGKSPKVRRFRVEKWPDAHRLYKLEEALERDEESLGIALRSPAIGSLREANDTCRCDGSLTGK
jgi:hypothetical protein